MARKPRLVMDEGLYHVIQRGNDRRKVFREESDYRHFYLLLRKYLKSYPSFLYHYCLMSNHLHLLLKVAKAQDLPRLMQGINLSYTLYYKKKYRFTGSLWQGRYKSILIESDEYLMECGRYIERNPLRAGLVADLADYYFSSYNFYANGRKDDIITPDPCYLTLSKDSKECMKLYKECVLQKRPYETILDKGLKI